MTRVAERAAATVDRARNGAEALMREIAGQGPEKTLGRGFAVVRDTDGKPVTGRAQLRADQAIEIQFRDGAIAARTSKPE
jgi:exodeoxyribonuclease VII large subunit